MKKSILFSACAFVAFILVFTSCSDDDDNSGGAPNPNVGVIVTDDGDHLLLSSITNDDGWAHYAFGYDSNGKLTYFRNWDDCTVSYDPFEMTWVDETNNYYNTGSYQFTFNGNGYASKIIYIDNLDEPSYNNYIRTGDGAFDLSYDSDGHLTKMSGYIYWQRNRDNYIGNETDSYTVNLTWNNGNLVSANVIIEEEEIENGQYSHSIENAEYSFTYGSTPNKYNQYIMAMTFEYDDLDQFFGFGFLGYLGKGTAYLPTKYEVSGMREGEEYGDTYGWDLSYSRNCSYTINNDGTIKTEEGGGVDNDIFTYHYTTLGSTRGVAEETVAETLSKQDKNRHKSFRARHREPHDKQMVE